MEELGKEVEKQKSSKEKLKLIYAVHSNESFCIHLYRNFHIFYFSFVFSVSVVVCRCPLQSCNSISVHFRLHYKVLYSITVPLRNYKIHCGGVGGVIRLHML